MVEELTPVIAIEAENGERELFLHIAGLFEHPAGTFVPDRTDHGPGAYDIGVGDRPDKVPIQGSAAVSHRIGFEIAGAIDVFGGGADRDLVLE